MISGYFPTYLPVLNWHSDRRLGQIHNPLINWTKLMHRNAVSAAKYRRKHGSQGNSHTHFLGTFLRLRRPSFSSVQYEIVLSVFNGVRSCPKSC